MAGSKQSWKKLDPAILRDEESDKPYSTSPSKILVGISPERVIREIKGMLVGDDFHSVEATLRGILETIEKTQYVTQGQWDAIEKMMERPKNKRQSTDRRRK